MHRFPISQETVSFFVRLLLSATEPVEQIYEFEEEVLRDQLIKMMELRAARAVMLNRDLLQIILMNALPGDSALQLEVRDTVHETYAGGLVILHLIF